MTTTLSDRPAPLILAPSGIALIVGNRQDFKRRCEDAIAGGQRFLVIDLTATGYIDNTGLGVLVSVGKKVRDAQGKMVLAGMNDDLREIFAVTRLDTHFEIAETVGRALQLLEVA